MANMKASIIICTRNRAHAITECLQSVDLAIRHAKSVEAEIIVVDNGSTDQTSEYITDWSKSCAVSVRLILETKPGLSYARNAGILASKGDLLIFTDDDCVMDRDFINNMMMHASTDSVPVIRGGRVELGDPSDLPVTILTDMKAKTWSYDLNSSRHENISGKIYGCNMVIPRSVIKKIGIFDVRLGAGKTISSAEDTDYLYRAYLKKIPLVYAPDMVVHHFHGRKLRSEGYKLFSNYAIGNGALFVKYFFVHPNFCRPLYWNFKNAIKEIVTGKNLFMPEIGFSYKNVIMNDIQGMTLFIYVSVIQRKKAYPN